MLGDIRGWPRLLHNASKQVKSASTPKRHEARLRKRSEYTWYRNRTGSNIPYVSVIKYL